MRYTYLLLNFFTIIIPVSCSFEHKLHFYHKWKYYLPGMFFTAFLFIVWDYFKTKHGVWSFNDDYIIGIRFFGLPVEEFLFFITVPYACTFIYETVSYFFRRRIFPDSSRYVLWALSIAAFVGSFFVLHKAYTFSVLLIISFVLPLATVVLQKNKLDSFIQMYIISLIPMAIVNGFLTALPVVIYNNDQNLGVRVGTIPIEDFIYCAILLLMNVSLYEWSRQRALRNPN
ncbi:MAG: rane protein [Bacteroidetes bacterium]|nr:rane protein [Bacteroidota bacterium]